MFASTKAVATAKFIGTKVVLSKAALSVGAGSAALATGLTFGHYEHSNSIVDETGTTWTAPVALASDTHQTQPTGRIVMPTDEAGRSPQQMREAIAY